MAGGAFKGAGRTPRQIVTEESYGRGMQYTASPLLEGFCKALVNFDFRDAGQMLVPRPGWRTLHSELAANAELPQVLHHHGQAIVRDTTTGVDDTATYILLNPRDDTTEYTDFADGVTLLEDEFSPEFGGQHSFSNIPQKVTQTLGVDDVYELRRKPRGQVQMLHNIPLSDPDRFKSQTFTPIKANLNGATYLPVKHTPDGGAARYGLGKLQMQQVAGVRQAMLEFVEPREVTPTEAINYGYNMLDATPYTFNDVPTSIGTIFMEGILPYADASCSELKFNAKVGEKITFRLFAQYPDTTTEWVFRWELAELGTENVTVYEDELLTANYYKHNGTTKAINYGVTPNTDFVRLTVQPPYKQFSVTVTAFNKLDLTEPIQVMSMASYTLVGDTKSNTNNIEVRTYPLHTAADMCSWKQRLVLWGVQSAPNMIFVSDINDPSYFPYPHNCEIFEEAVVSCVPYLGELLVFTESKIYKLRWSDDGLSFVSEMVQDKLSLSAFDRETVLLVQNMVYFKNGNYFYMIVPRAATSASTAALQLAPISTPITYLLDHFADEVRRMVFTLYNPDDPNYFPRKPAGTHYDLRIQDYHKYLDGTTVRNVYKYELVLVDTATGDVTDVVLRLDFLLNYDTLARTWTIYLMQGNDVRLLPYRHSVTDATIFMTARTEVNPDGGYDVYVDFVKPDLSSRVDEFPVVPTAQIKSRIIRNHQMLDTGNRDHNTSYKKRYREVQFRVNATDEESLQFGTEFIIDDQIRKDLFEYEVNQVTDPDDPNLGWVYIEKTFADPLNSVGATILEDADDPSEPYLPSYQVVPSDTVLLQSNRWVLDVSKLAHAVSNKLRLKVSGKGYAPRLILVSFNDRYYELLNHSWVFRTMNAR